MGLMDSLVNTGVNNVARPFINKAISGYGEINEIKLEDRKLKLKGVLCGLEDKEITVTCGDVRISEDGSEISLHGFSSNMPFAEKALNNFACGPFKIEDSKVQMALAQARKLL